MIAKPHWLDSDPLAKAAIEAADKAYDEAVKAYQGLPLYEKVGAHRRAVRARRKAYEAAIAQHDEGVRL